MKEYKMTYDDEYEAIRSIIEGSDKGYKSVSAFLYPHLKLESAYARLKACLNPEKDERLTFGQIIAISRFCNRADALFFIADELGYKRPEIKPIEDQESHLIQEFLRAKQDLQKIAEKIEKNYEKRFSMIINKE